jgi:hypothetical protein
LSKSHRCVAREWGKEKSLLTAGASGSITNDQRSLLLYRPALRLIARLALVAMYSGGRRSFSSRERANDVNAELPLHEGDDPPVVEVGEDRSRAQLDVC